MNMEISCPTVHFLCPMNENLFRKNTKGLCQTMDARHVGFVSQQIEFLPLGPKKALITVIHIVV